MRISDVEADQLPPPTMGHPLSIGAPLGSAGSGGSGSGHGHNMIMGPGWVGAPPPLRNEPSPPQWEMPWTGPQSGGSGSASTTTYGAIYNPAAPPPSANYTCMASNYSGYGSESNFGGQMHPAGVHHSSGKHFLKANDLLNFVSCVVHVVTIFFSDLRGYK